MPTIDRTHMNAPKEALLDRFLRYVRIDTRSDENSTSCPSTAKQWDLLRLLHEELLGMGVKDATIAIEGFGVHPGYAKGKLVNAIRIMGDFLTRLPREMSPEMTDQREGYIHPYVMSGQDNSASLRLLLRDFEMGGIEKQKKIIEGIAEEVRALHPKAKINVDVKESYLNMRYQIDKEPRLVTYAEEAIKRIGVT